MICSSSDFRKLARLTYDSRISLALFQTYSASDYIAAQCLRWGIIYQILNLICTANLVAFKKIFEQRDVHSLIICYLFWKSKTVVFCTFGQQLHKMTEKSCQWHEILITIACSYLMRMKLNLLGIFYFGSISYVATHKFAQEIS